MAASDRHYDASAPARADPMRQAHLDAELQRVLASTTFKPSRRHRRLLEYLVRHTVDGHESALKESVLAAEVFERPLATFDPVRDTIVRVEARRLR